MLSDTVAYKPRMNLAQNFDTKRFAKMSLITIISFIFLIEPLQSISKYLEFHEIIINYYKICTCDFPFPPRKKALGCDICHMEKIILHLKHWMRVRKSRSAVNF